MKKLFSVLLAVMLVMSLSVTAFADGTIQVMNAPQDSEYHAYKIFDVVELEAFDDVSGSTVKTGELKYTLFMSSQWYDVLVEKSESADAMGEAVYMSKFPGLTYAEDGGNLVVSWGPGFSAAEFAEFLRGVDENGEVDDRNLHDKTYDMAWHEGDQSASISKGYYLVVNTSYPKAKAALTTVLDEQNVKIQNKNDMPFDKEIIDGENALKVDDVQVGDSIGFRITTVVPVVDDDATFYAFYVSDVMDAGLDFMYPITVWIDANGNGLMDTDGADGGEEIVLTEISAAEAPLSGDQVRYDKNGKTFELSLDMLLRGKDSELALYGKNIYIDYKAIVNEKAIAVVTENNAVLQYGDNPSDLTIKDSQTKVYDSQIIIDKFENGAPEQKLEGAEFVLSRATTDGTRYYRVNTYKAYTQDEVDASVWDAVAGQNVPVLTEGVDYVNDMGTYWAIDAYGNRVPSEVEWIDVMEDATVFVTNNEGAAHIAGLEDGDYALIETKAPAGYSKLNDSIAIHVDGSLSVTPGMDKGQVAAILTNVANVANTPGTNLPSTGSIGTTIFYVVGSILVASSLILLVIRKRSSMNNA